MRLELIIKEAEELIKDSNIKEDIFIQKIANIF